MESQQTRHPQNDQTLHIPDQHLLQLTCSLSIKQTCRSDQVPRRPHHITQSCTGKLRPPDPSHASACAGAKQVCSQPCPTHSDSATPFLRTQLQRPQARNALQVLSQALADIAEGRGCNKCLMKEAARTATLCVRELRAVKKNGEWSKEEKKAMKNEAKATFNEIKQEVKQTWKSKD